MGKFIAEQTILELIKKGIDPINAKIGVLGLTFKENCPDIRNTKIVDIIENLKNYKCDVLITDEWADRKETRDELDLDLVDLNQINKMDSIIVAVSHEAYHNLVFKDWKKMLNFNGVIMDIKSIYKDSLFVKSSFTHWKL